MTSPPSLMRWISSNPVELKLIEKNPIPYDVKIKLSFICNAQCYYCLHGIRSRTSLDTLHKMELSSYEWKKIISELYNLGTRVITFSGGEPTLRKDLPELVKYCSKLGIRAKMTSNGSLITKDLAYKLAKNKLKTINISLDGIGEIHDNVRGKGMFERTMRGINFLGMAKKEFGKPQIRINHVITSQNAEFLNEFLAYIDKIPEISAIHLLLIDFEHNSNQLSLSKSDVLQLLNQFKNIQDKVKFDIRETNTLVELKTSDFVKGRYSPSSLLIPCYFPSVHMFVLPNGDVNVCCGAERSNEMILGNLRDQTVFEVWNGKKYQELRKFLEKKKFNFCAACDHGYIINSSINSEIHE